MHLFRSVAPEEVVKAYEASARDIGSLTEWHIQQSSRLRRIRTVAAGGQKAAAELVRGEKESPQKWAMRQHLFANVPLVGLGSKLVAWLLFGKGVGYEVWVGDRPPSMISQRLAGAQTDPASDAYAEWHRDTLEANSWDWFNNALLRKRLIDTTVAVKVFAVDAEGVAARPPYADLRIVAKGIEHCRPVYDPDDNQRLLGVIENTTPTGDDPTWIVWTTDEVVALDDKSGQTRPIVIEGEVAEHPVPGIIPFAFFGGEDLISDAMEYQKVLINKKSTNNTIERSNGFPIKEIKGKPEATATDLDGNPTVVIADDSFIYFPDPTSGGVNVVRQDAPLQELRDSYEAERDEAFGMAFGLPQDVISGNSVAEQPTTIMLRWLKSMVIRDMVKHEAVDYIDSLFHIMAAYGASDDADFGLPDYDPDAVDWNLEFPESPLPMDDREDRRLAKDEVSDGLRLRRDYLQEYVVPDATPEEIDMVEEALDSNRRANLDAIEFLPELNDAQ